MNNTMEKNSGYGKVTSRIKTVPTGEHPKKKKKKNVMKAQFSTQVRTDYLALLDKVLRLREIEYAKELIKGKSDAKKPTKVAVVEEMFESFIAQNKEALEKENLL